ncbi:MAG: hypothetical protein JNN10_16225 [Sphingopyxis sp.]|uniref:hypothetical protein n=1 Tax=Sphingopyxis sp. TaxID=1908224 RepID=UPI001A4870A1|nr:hypothetical protein [Sphingopyxis sp.]MBL9067829.1 hypothetical protein [Sphingopyxis sp.]
MGDVIQLPTGPRAPYFLLAWDPFTNHCRLDFVHPGGAREHLLSRKDYLDLRDVTMRCADQAGLPMVDHIDPAKWLGRRP